MSTVSEQTCQAFSHLGGVKKTFAYVKEPSPGEIYAQSLLDELADRRNELIRQRKERVRQQEIEQERLREERIRQEKIAMEKKVSLHLKHLEKLGQANKRVEELIREGMDPKYMFKDKSVEFMQMLDKANSGDAKAQYVFAQALWRGVSGAREEGVKNRGGKGWYWCNKAAENGYGYAQLMRGITYRNDAVESGDLEDHKKAVDWLEKALSHSEIIDKDREKDGVYLKVLNSSRITLGVSYINGKKESPDFHKAMSYFEAVEDSGDSRGAERKKMAEDLCKELKESLQNMKDAAEYGSDDALNILGMIYGGYSEYKQYQLIVEVDREKSFEYF
ncbi:MAG: hypothetical protein PUJ80_09335, partial [Verrucomicrobiota bacterium]|nr:hypothetical protein [Verrucomicrobiota bacterium]